MKTGKQIFKTEKSLSEFRKSVLAGFANIIPVLLDLNPETLGRMQDVMKFLTFRKR